MRVEARPSLRVSVLRRREDADRRSLDVELAIDDLDVRWHAPPPQRRSDPRAPVVMLASSGSGVEHDAARGYLYLHFMRWQSARWMSNRPAPTEGAWLKLDRVVQLDWRHAAADGFCISPAGFTPLGCL